MPIYSYTCGQCGPFDMLRPMAECRKPGNCPECGQPSRKRVTPPRLNLMPSARRAAHRVNEKSANQPRVVSAEESRAQGRKLSKADKHGHSHSHVHATESRPWQVGH